MTATVTASPCAAALCFESAFSLALSPLAGPAPEWSPSGLARAPILQLFRPSSIFIHANRHVAQNPIVHAHAAFEFGNFATGTIHLEQNIGALTLVADFVRKLTAAHHFRFGDV